ncbi:MAG: hypothetical protein ACRDQW_14695 [Haloechinothrix sp.]
MANSVAEAAAFMNAAATGELGIDPDAAQTVLNKIRTGKDQVENLIARAGGLGVQPRLGANPVGEAMAMKFSDRASGGGDSYVHALHNLHLQYEQIERALVTAIRNYDEMDTAAADSFRRKA